MPKPRRRDWSLWPWGGESFLTLALLLTKVPPHGSHAAGTEASAASSNVVKRLRASFLWVLVFEKIKHFQQISWRKAIQAWESGEGNLPAVDEAFLVQFLKQAAWSGMWSSLNRPPSLRPPAHLMENCGIVFSEWDYKPNMVSLQGHGPFFLICNVTAISTLAMLQLIVYHLNQNSMAVIIAQLSGKERKNLCIVQQPFLLLLLQNMLEDMLKCEISPLCLSSNLFSFNGFDAFKQNQ